MRWRRLTSGSRPPTCQKWGSSSRAVGAERLRVDVAEPLGEDAEAAPPEELAGVVQRLLASCERSKKTCATANASSSASAGLWPPARTSSDQILRGMSTRTPQPSPSPSTFPARCSIFWRFARASSTGSRFGVASLRTEA